MVFLNTEGRINENAHLIQGMLFGINNTLALYVIENNGMRMLIDTGESDVARKLVSKLKKMNLLPIHKILLTHSHWDHVGGTAKLLSLMNESPIEVLASEKAIDNLKNPKKMNESFGIEVGVVDNVKPLKNGDIIDLNGLKLEIVNLFGHTQDSIGVMDRKNKILYCGDAIIDKFEPFTMTPAFLPPDYEEENFFKTIQLVRTLPINSIALAHFGVWKDDDFQKTLTETETLHKESKKAIIQWVKEKKSIPEIATLYCQNFIPNSKIFSSEHHEMLLPMIPWFTKGLKLE